MFRSRLNLPCWKDALICGILAVTALLGTAGIIGATAVQAAAVIHEQQQVGGAHSTVLGTRSFAFYAALVAFFTVKLLPLSHSVLPHQAVRDAESSR